MTPPPVGIATSTLERYRAAIGVLRELPRDVGAFRAMPEAELLEANLLRAEAGILLEANAALIAGEISHRSRPELGHDGLAQRTGHRTPMQFLRNTTGALQAAGCHLASCGRAARRDRR